MRQRMTPTRVRSIAVVVMVLTVGAACGSDGDGDASTPSTTNPPSTTSTSPTSTSPSVPPPTTAAPSTPPDTSTSTTVAVDSTVTVPTSTTPPSDVDDVAPPAPENVTCAPGGGSQEVLLEWDAPPDPDDIVDVRLYVNDGSGFARVAEFAVDSGQVMISSTRWSAVAYPVPPSSQVRMAVTFGDAAGNESGWNPIDVFYDYSGADCLS